MEHIQKPLYSAYSQVTMSHVTDYDDSTYWKLIILHVAGLYCDRVSKKEFLRNLQKVYPDAFIEGGDVE